ncbi:MAG: Lrp/AsnC ligand binding domain-containing protein [Candidatus Bathyarchaeia archaeon]
MISACVLIRTGSGRFNEVLEALKRFKGVRDAFATLGRYDIAVDLEADDWQSLSSAVLRISRIAGVVFTETLVEVKL